MGAIPSIDNGTINFLGQEMSSASLSMNEVQLGKRPAETKLEEVPMFRELAKPTPNLHFPTAQLITPNSSQTFLQRY